MSSFWRFAEVAVHLAGGAEDTLDARRGCRRSEILLHHGTILQRGEAVRRRRDHGARRQLNGSISCGQFL